MKRLRPAQGWLALALVAAAALLLSLVDVLHLAVTQGVQRRSAELERSNAVWRCNVLPGQQSRIDCRRRYLGAPLSRGQLQAAGPQPVGSVEDVAASQAGRGARQRHPSQRVVVTAGDVGM